MFLRKIIKEEEEDVKMEDVKEEEDVKPEVEVPIVTNRYVSVGGGVIG